MSLKDAIDDLAVVYEKSTLIREWAALSPVKSLVVAGSLGIGLSIAFYGYVGHLINQEQLNGRSRSELLNSLHEELKYKSAIDVINTCIETPLSETKLRSWYCDNASKQYQSLGTAALPERTQEVVHKRAFSAMRNDVSNKLRDIEFNRVLRASPTPERQQLDLLLNTAVILIVACVSMTLFVGSYLYIRLLPMRSRLPKSENGLPESKEIDPSSATTGSTHITNK